MRREVDLPRLQDCRVRSPRPRPCPVAEHGAAQHQVRQPVNVLEDVTNDCLAVYKRLTFELDHFLDQSKTRRIKLLLGDLDKLAGRV